MDFRSSGETALVENLRLRRAELIVLLDACSDHWGYEDPIYRFYHQSFKVYALQDRTLQIVRFLESLAPGQPLNPWFREILADGTGHEFKTDHNRQWTRAARPILEAFFHARFFLEMAVRYSTLTEPPLPLPSGYAALLYLYGLR